jgi:Protein of unknown function (DUF2490)
MSNHLRIYPDCFQNGIRSLLNKNITMKNFAIITVTLLYFANANAQLSPPGLGDTNDALWSAIGVAQKINQKNTSVTYIGEGRISGPDSHDFTRKQSILVINEEVYHTISPNWKYSYALSYRRQNEYAEAAPEAIAIQQEFRLYGRLSNTQALGRIKWKNAIRQEARKFYTPDFNTVEDIFQLRTRVKTQLSVPIGSSDANKLTGSAEALFAISDERGEGWGNYGYTESRFCFYYTYKPVSLPVTFDIGYMNDLIGYGHDVADASYLAFDVILEDPF